MIWPASPPRRTKSQALGHRLRQSASRSIAAKGSARIYPKRRSPSSNCPRAIIPTYPSTELDFPRIQGVEKMMVALEQVRQPAQFSGRLPVDRATSAGFGRNSSPPRFGSATRRVRPARESRSATLGGSARSRPLALRGSRGPGSPLPFPPPPLPRRESRPSPGQRRQPLGG